LRLSDGTVARGELLWYVAGRMGAVAGANMAGSDARYQPAVFLNVSEFAGLDFCGVGDIVPDQEGVETWWAPDASRGTARLVLRDGQIIGGCFLGDIRLGDLTRGLIERGTRWDELRADHPLRARFGR
jgi:NAD(P)H-nitrite reductase large subunit